MSGFYDITNAREGNLIVGVFSLAKEETKTVWLTTEERASYDQSGIKIRSNTTVARAPNLFGRIEIRDIDESSAGGNTGGDSGSSKSKVINPDSPGVEDMGEGGYWYTLTLEDAGCIITVSSMATIQLPSSDEVEFPLHTIITLITDDEVGIRRKEYYDEEENFERARLYKAADDNGNNNFRIPYRSIATLVLYRYEPEEHETRWLISGPGVTLD